MFHSLLFPQDMIDHRDQQDLKIQQGVVMTTSGWLYIRLHVWDDDDLYSTDVNIYVCVYIITDNSEKCGQLCTECHGNAFQTALM